MDSLMDTAPCGFVSFSDDGTIVDVNQTLAEMLGYARVELAGWHVEKILPAGGRIFYHTYLLPLLKVNGVAEEIYVALRSKRGDDIPVLLSGARREREGGPVNDCVCLRMIRRNEYENQLLHARRLAEESSDAKAKFLSMMTHDLRSPLAAIYGNAQVLEQEALNSEQMDAVRSILIASRMQMTLINDILEFARLESGQVQIHTRPIRLAEVMGRAEALMRAQAMKAGLRFEMAQCDRTVSVMADPDRLQQVLLNLITNAVKFTPPGGDVSVLCEASGGRVRIRVRDSGIGIADDQQQRIFVPFVQLEHGAESLPRAAVQRGVGLGLAISRDLARAMGGDVTVSSSAGAGSCFTIDLPAASETADASADFVEALR